MLLVPVLAPRLLICTRYMYRIHVLEVIATKCQPRGPGLVSRYDQTTLGVASVPITTECQEGHALSPPMLLML